MNHTTLRAIEVLLGASLEDSAKKYVCGRLACGTAHHKGFHDDPFHYYYALDIKEQRRDPTDAEKKFKSVDCPTCRVLLDAALEGKDIVADVWRQKGLNINEAYSKKAGTAFNPPAAPPRGNNH